mgnify:CR=1 FL=1
MALNLEPEFFEKPGTMDCPMTFLRLLHYSGSLLKTIFKPRLHFPFECVLHEVLYTGEESIPEKGIYGAGAHSDWGLLTLLISDGTPGLQVSFVSMPMCCLTEPT